MDSSLFHSLQGKDIYFRALNIVDVNDIHDYASDEDVSRFIGWRLMNSPDETREYVEEMIKREKAETHLYASILLKSTDRIIGTAMIFNFDLQVKHAEIGYVLHKDHWGKGYATQAISLMDGFCFESLKLHKLHARVVDRNIGSARVLEKNGYQLEGRFRDYYLIDDVYCDGLFFGKIKD